MVALYPRDGRSAEALIEHATRALRNGDERAVAANPSVLPVGAIERLDRVLDRVAAGEISVLILGETGSGKEVLARRIHALSPRDAADAAPRPSSCA